MVRTVASAILGCGGWVLSRGTNDSVTVNIRFEFERRDCVEMYTTLVAAGVELSKSGHIWFNELCRCTLENRQNCGEKIASVELEIETIPPKMVFGSQPELVG